MGVVTVRPSGTLADTGWTVVDTNAHGALSDDSDSTWVENDTPTAGDLSALDVAMGTPTIPSGARITGVRLRRRWSIEDSAEPGLMRNRVRPGAGGQWLTWDVSTSIVGGTPSFIDSQSQWWAEKPAGGIWSVADVAGLEVRSATSDVEVRLYEIYADIEFNEPPVVSVVGPSSPVTDTTRPTVVWSYTDADGDPQDAYGVRVYTADQEPSGGWPDDPFDVVGEPVWASGTVLASGQARQLPVDLDNGITYRVYVRARQSVYGLWSPWGHAAFTMDLDGPDAPDVTVAAEPDAARFRLELSDPLSSDPAADWFDIEWRDGNGWSPLRHGRQVPVEGDVQYWEGAFASDWVAGLTLNAGSRSKETDHLWLQAGDSGGAADWAWVTDDPVDLTGVSELRVDWAAQRSGQQARATLVASTSKMGSWNNFAARLTQPAMFARRVDILDVSSLSGLYFLRVHAADFDISTDVNARVQMYGLAFDQNPGPNPPTIVYDHEAPLQGDRRYRVRGVAEVDGLPVAGDATVTVPFALGAPGRWLTDLEDPGRLHLRLLVSSSRRTQQARDVVHRPVGMDTVVVESEPPSYSHDVETVTLDAQQEAELREAVRSRRPLIFRDRRTTAFVRIAGDVSRGQVATGTVDADRWSLTLVEIEPPAV